MSEPINQKEYIKKYLSKKPSDKKKKKKKKDVDSNRIKIIDDNIDLNIIANNNPEDDEDAPQIVAIIDERPPSMQIDEITHDAIWKPIAPAVLETDTKDTLLKSGFKVEKIENTKMKSLNIDLPSQKVLKKSTEKSVISISEKKTEFKGNTGSDLSPPRKSNKIQRERCVTQQNSKDNSPPRKKHTNNDNSPPRRLHQNSDLSPPRKSSKRQNSDYSPPRRKHTCQSSNKTQHRKSRWETTDDCIVKKEKSSSPLNKRTKLTLEGKTAGLQNSKELVEETKRIKEQEMEIFKTISKEISGENAPTIIRDRKTGRVRNLEEELKEKQKRQKEEEQKIEKYSKWGKGLVQIANNEQKLEDELHEMSKPLARYADDEDLEKYLKEQEREGDPMLAYIKRKKRKEAIKSGVQIKPQFEGHFMPNRYGIRPGHRWDGVDRSNGYEKKWFEVQNERTAQKEDSYKWSTEDM